MQSKDDLAVPVSEAPAVDAGLATKPSWILEFEALPDWAQKMVRGLMGSGGYGNSAAADSIFGGGMDDEALEKYGAFHALIRLERYADWSDGFCEMRRLAAAMTAPWPKPEPTPHEAMTTSNAVEILADPQDCAFDQPCHFGHRVESHAVYCHNDAWLDSPRKCHRNRGDYRHEDCPGFVPLTVVGRER